MLRLVKLPDGSKRSSNALQALQFKHAFCGSAALSCSMARCSALFAAASCAFAAPSEAALRTLSTSTVNLIASAAALVRK
eukprot:CAMPEP_0177187484 /NCGR_PEP_ID=MMETSP0367-20130122/19222_1 /TAXON_ID=447022 ORGANISM="Scrippsiella hangoei-like, Strain SHHI-4" /NCGR_SAMPLE_ID=MMETSP0367 /ASSEMBLY_ACC=CAM_ASM_000362 /LENGTH=79 /DNA_ID=CAMNT_0018634883 /DNA_START=337 /DNA_END=576 /DNA_ORIENTATION=-